MEADSPYKAPESEIGGGGDAEGLMEAFIGPKNTNYYLNVFDKFESGGSSLSWHWPALFITWFWLAYRKMWAWFFAYWLLFPIVVTLPAAGLMAINEVLGVVFYFAVYLLLPPMVANRLYYRHAQTKTAQARATSTDAHGQALEAARLGGTSNVALVLIPVVLVGFLGIIAAISVPAYQDYVVRAQVSEGVNLANEAKIAIADYREDNGRAPVDNAEAGLPEPEEISGLYTASVAVYNGEITVTYGNEANQLLQGKELYIFPAGDESPFDWACESDDIPINQLPAMCRY